MNHQSPIVKGSLFTLWAMYLYYMLVGGEDWKAYMGLNLARLVEFGALRYQAKEP